MWTKEFWKAAAERAVRGGAIAASALWGVTAITDINLIGNTAALTAVGFLWGAVGSLLLSLAGATVSGEKGSPSFTKAEVVNTEAPALPVN